jgi:hypothetical protein
VEKFSGEKAYKGVVYLLRLIDVSFDGRISSVIVGSGEVT